MVVDLSTVPAALQLGASAGPVLGGGRGLLNDDGVLYKWSSDSAMGDGADTREVVGDNSNRHGQWDATMFYGAQTVLVRGSARATSLAALFAAERRMRAAVAVAYDVYTFTMPGFAGVLNARRQGKFQWTPMAGNASDTYAYAQFSFTLYCPDSYMAAAVAKTFSLAFPATSGIDWSDPGVDWTDPGADWSASDVASSASLVNEGPTWVPLLMTFTGPMTSVQLTLQQGTTALRQTITNQDIPGTDILAAGQTLAVDNGTGMVTLNGQSSRNSWLAGDLLLVPPGTSAIYLTGPASAGTVVGSFSPARP